MSPVSDKPDDRIDDGSIPPFWPMVRRGAALTVGVVLILAAAGAVYVLRDLVVQILIALFIAISLDPLIRFMLSKRIKRGPAVAVTWIFLLLVLAGVVWFVIAPLVTQATKLGGDIPQLLQDLRAKSAIFQDLEQRFHLEQRIRELGDDLPGVLARDALNAGRTLLSALVSTLLIVVLSIYFMLDMPRLRRGAVMLTPRRHHATARFTVSTVIDKVGAYMIGNIIISIIAGVTSLVVMLALRVPFALPLAIIVAITDLIPLIGATIGAAVCVLVAAASVDNWWSAVGLLIFFIVYQQLENYVIAPRVLRGAVQVSAVGVLISALIGAALLGVIGAVMGVPIAAALKALMQARPWAEDEEGEPEAAAAAGPSAQSDAAVPAAHTVKPAATATG
jgi:predicted PurR-regulated permease PerM